MADSAWSPQAVATRAAALAQSRDSLANSTVFAVSLILLVAWLAGVIYTTTKHEFARDEVRALSISLAAHPRGVKTFP